jgi:hypothetical protein
MWNFTLVRMISHNSYVYITLVIFINLLIVTDLRMPGINGIELLKKSPSIIYQFVTNIGNQIVGFGGTDNARVTI